MPTREGQDITTSARKRDDRKSKVGLLKVDDIILQIEKRHRRFIQNVFNLTKRREATEMIARKKWSEIIKISFQSSRPQVSKPPSLPTRYSALSMNKVGHKGT